jgi:tetratricopeptide (TPR) repeat protein
MGKIRFSATDFGRNKARFEQLLFISDKKLIIESARYTYKKILPRYKQGMMDKTGRVFPMDADIVFATVQDISIIDYTAPTKNFDYLVIDNIGSFTSIYHKFIHSINPEFLLVLTSSPFHSIDMSDLALNIIEKAPITITLSNNKSIIVSPGRQSEAVKIAEEALLIADRLTYAGEKFDSAEEIRLGDAANLAGHTSRAEGYYSQALHNSKLRKNKQIQAEALNKLGTIRKNRRHHGELKKAEDFYGESYAIYCEIGDREGQGNLLNNLALIAKVRGHFDEAEDLFQKCLENRLEIEDRLGESKTLHNLGNIRRVRCDFNGAQRFYNRSLKIKYDINDKIGEGRTLHSLGLLSLDKKDYKKAKLFLEQSLKIRVEVGDSRGKAGVLNSLGNLALATGDFKTAALLCKESLSIYKAHDNRNGWAVVLDSLGDIAMANEAFKEADKFYNDSLRISQGDGKGEMPIDEAATLHNLGTNAIKLDNPEMAEKYFRSHVQIKNGLDLPLDEWYVEHGYTDPDAEWDFPPPEED